MRTHAAHGCARASHDPHPQHVATTGRDYFDSLDRNGDGRVSVDDLKAAMRQRNLPERYAQDFVRSARGGRWWSQSITCATMYSTHLSLCSLSKGATTDYVCTEWYTELAPCCNTDSSTGHHAV